MCFLIKEEIKGALDVVIYSPVAFPVRHNDLTGQGLRKWKKRSGDGIKSKESVNTFAKHTHTHKPDIDMQ